MDQNYYEGKLQLRNPNEEVINFIRNQFKLRNSKNFESLENSKNFQKHNEKVWIAKQETVKNGMDLYISSNRFLLALGKKLKKSFKGELKKSRKLHSKDRQTSKTTYRVTVLFRLDKPDNEEDNS